MTRPFKQRLRAKEPLVGCFVMAASPTIAEMCGYAGFDFVILDQEHGPADAETLENQIRAAEASGIAALVRVPWGSRWLIQRALDAGAEGIVVPHVTTAAEAEEIVRFSHYPGRGVRGLATTARAGRHGNVSVADHLPQSLQRTCVILQIEDAEALSEVSAIAGVDGVDSIFIGPADLSASLGHPGQPGHPEVAAAIEGVIRDTEAVGGPVVSSFIRDAEDARFWRENRGVQVLCLSTVAIFTTALRGLAQALVVPQETREEAQA
ncbi:aldolase/citrate lyase family protein [Cereibacter azotoformans]|uniref:HpcH/HpaI aldolase family protein n=1 Tax=Cereibacter azotoformans TaxID=43057 RepID=UPI000C6CC0DB|nr:aldolase/citrate lyase family protein [Cereibacter azotoformans]ULB09735.1 aldolase/citrate lyase family protein [Cereibacter azotoformans]